MPFHHALVFLLSFTLAVPAAFAGACGDILFRRGYQTQVEGLVAGQKAYGKPADDYELDRQTEYDLELDEIEKLFEGRLTTDFAYRRLSYMLRHPLLDSDQIRARQIIIQYIADHPEQFAPLRAHLQSLNEVERNYTKAFQELKNEDTPIVGETFWMVVTLLCYQAATIGKYVALLSVPIQLLILKRAYSQSLANAISRALPRREVLEPYRKMMISINYMVAGLRGTPKGDEVSDALARIFRGPKTNVLDDLWAYFNHYATENSPGLVRGVPPDMVDRSKDALNPLYRKFMFMQKVWSVPVPWWNKRVVLFNMNNTEDFFFLSNFRMRKMRKILAAQKEQVASILSAAADLEVSMAVADLYNEHRKEMAFLEILDRDKHSQFVMEQADHPVTKLTGVSTPNDVWLGHPDEGNGNSFAVAAAGTGEGSSHYQRTILVNALWSQLGWPVFAKSGKLTPFVFVSSLGLKDRLASGTSFSRAEAERWAFIERLPESYPHNLVMMNDPFTVGRTEESEALKIEVVRKMIEQPTIGVMSTRNRDFLARIRDWKDVALYRMENRVRLGFEFERDVAQFDPERTFGVLESSGVSSSFIEDARIRVHDLRGGVLPSIPQTVEQVDSRVSQDDPSEKLRERRDR